MGKVRIFSLAKQLNLQSKALMAALVELGVTDVNPASAIDEETAKAALELLAEQARQARAAAEVAAQAEAEKAAEAAEAARQAGLTEEAAAKAAAAAVAAGEVKARPRPGEAVVQPTEPGADKAHVTPEIATREDKETEKYFRRRGPARLEEEDGLRELERQLRELEAREEAERAQRARAGEVVPLPELARRPTGPRIPTAITVPPAVAVLGHVDHGKTTLLDSLRNSNVVATEHGGITQAIGASEVTVGEKKIVFIDTPGHEAFTAMRARGAMVTDIAILVVAADDGVMPQTVEAIKHAKAAKVPIIVAINKVDAPGADVQRVKQQLLEHELVPEDWGGDTIVVPVSALKKEGLTDLLDMILLVAELKDLWADPEGEFAGIVIESSVHASQGTLCTVLVRNGTLRVGDSVVCGTCYGRIRRLRDWQGRSVKEMLAGFPVEVVGLTDLPEAGEVMTRVATPKEGRQVAGERGTAARQAELAGIHGVSLRDLYDEATGTANKQLNVILKGDVWGSVQALESQLLQLDRKLEEVDINVVATGVGEVNESDVLLAVASKAVVLAFQIGADDKVRQAAAAEGVEIRSYDVIYRALEDIRAALLGLLAPVFETVYIGRAQVLQLFRVSRIGVIAGCSVLDGRMEAGAEIRVLRNNNEVFRGPLESLRRFTDEARMVEAGNECGIATRAFRGWEIGDMVEAYASVQMERTLAMREDVE